MTFEEYTRHIDWLLTVDRRRAGVRRPVSGRLLAAGPYLLAASGTRASIAGSNRALRILCSPSELEQKGGGELSWPVSS